MWTQPPDPALSRRFDRVQKSMCRLFPKTTAFWHWTKSDRYVLRRMLLKPKKNNVPTTYRVPDTDVPTKNMYYVFQWKAKVPILTDIWYHMSTSTYESARTPVIKSSTIDHTASFFCFIQDRSIPRNLHRLVSKKSSISQWRFWFYNNCCREPIHDCSYTGERIISSVSPYSRILWWQPQYQ